MNLIGTVIYNRESEYIEFKAHFNSSSLATVCAFANYHDGRIFIGIEDDGNVLGIGASIEIVMLNIENSINDNIVPRPFYEIHKHVYQEKNILEIIIYHGDFTPYTYRNNAYRRMGASTIEVDENELQMLILNGRNISFENLKCDTQELVFAYFEEKVKRELKIAKLSDDLFKTFGLIDSEKFNNAAALLSDNNPIETSRLSLLRYAGSDAKNIEDMSVKEKCSILEQFDESISFYKKHIRVSEIVEKGNMTTVEEIPLVAYREAVANAIFFTDYMKTGDIKVEFYDDSVKIISPGGLPLGISMEDFLTGRFAFPRNKIICHIFFRLKINDKMATGVRKIREYYSIYNEKPSFLVNESSVSIILPKVTKPNGNVMYPFK